MILVWREKLIILFILALTATILLSPLTLNLLIPNELDYLNHFAGIVQAKMASIEGQFPLRVMPLLSGMRYPFYQFYSPSSYWLAGNVYRYLAVSSPFAAYQMTLGLALFCGGIYFYRLTEWLVGCKRIALVTSVAYLSSPYYILLLDHIGAFNESIALGILPAVLFYTLGFFSAPALTGFLGMTFGWYCLATTHLITFVYASIFIAVFLILMTTDFDKLKNLIYTGLTYTYSFLLALWFLAPVGIYQKVLFIRGTFEKLSDPLYGVHLTNLLSPLKNIGMENSTQGFVDTITTIHPSLGLPFLAGIGTCLVLAFRNYHFPQSNAVKVFLPLVIVFSLLLFIVWSPFDLWHKLPINFNIGQYSWRLLGQCNWVCGLLFGLAVSWLFNYKLSNRAMLLGILLILFANNSWLQTSELSFMGYNFADFIKNPEFSVNQTVYTIDGVRYPQFVGNIDSSPVQAPFVGNKLSFQRAYKFNKNSLATAKAPVLILEGVYNGIIPIKIRALLDDKPVATQDLKISGIFKWKIPLSYAKENNTVPFVKLEFTRDYLNRNSIDSINPRPIPPVVINKAFLSGQLDEAKAMQIDTTLSHCNQVSTTTTCIIPPAPNSKLIELPTFYYPNLLALTLNGKPIQPESVIYAGLLNAAVTVPAHQVNIIKFKFSGLVWANQISVTSWGVWFVVFIIMLRQKFLRSSQASVIHKNRM